MSFSFQIHSVGQDDFLAELESRLEYRKRAKTQFVDLTSFLPPLLVPAVLTSRLYPSPESAHTFVSKELAVKWFAYLYFNSSYIPPSNERRKGTRTPRQRLWNFSNNVLLWKDFVRSFCAKDGKLCIENFRTLRVCTDKVNEPFEPHWESVLGPDRILNAKTDEWNKVDEPIYRDNVFGVIHGMGVLSRKEKQHLNKIWRSISEGYAPGYHYYVTNSLDEAAGKTHLTVMELKDQMESHLAANPFPQILQCEGLRGREIDFVNGDSYVSFLGCPNCDQSRSGQDLCVPDDLQRCRIEGLTPLGEINRWKRNDFTSKKVLAAVTLRDDDRCVVGANIPGEACNCKGAIVMGHVVSALRTHHTLTIYDGLRICTKHNGRMGTKDLLYAFPRLKSWVKKNSINAKGMEIWL